MSTPHIVGKTKLENPQLEIRHFISTQNMKKEKKTVKEHSPTRKVGRAIKLYKPQTCWQKKYKEGKKHGWGGRGSKTLS